MDPIMIEAPLVLSNNAALAINPHLFKRLGFDPHGEDRDRPEHEREVDRPGENSR